MSQLGQLPGTGAYRDLKETKQVSHLVDFHMLTQKKCASTKCSLSDFRGKNTPLFVVPLANKKIIPGQGNWTQQLLRGEQLGQQLFIDLFN